MVGIVIVFNVVVFAAAIVVIIALRQTNTQTDMEALRLTDWTGQEVGGVKTGRGSTTRQNSPIYTAITFEPIIQFKNPLKFVWKTC